MPSPIAINPASPSHSIFKKMSKSPSNLPASAASYLSAVSQADAHARARSLANVVTPTSTPALSVSSSVTGASEDSILREGEAKMYDNDDGLSYPSTPPTSEQVHSTVHSEFGHCTNEEYRFTSQYPVGKPVPHHEERDPPYYILLSTYVSYMILICLGHLRDFIGKRLKSSAYTHLLPHDGYAPLNSDFDSFYTRRLKVRIDDCFSTPVTGVPGRTIICYDRDTHDYNVTLHTTGRRIRGLNISSYNYLGFAQARGGCADAVAEAISRYGLSCCGARLEGGSLDLHQTAERLVAQFVGHEDSVISSMGFATNSTIIPALVGKGCLIISDEFNHASIRFGVRLSGASVRMFKHNNMKSFENLLREVISQGQPKTHRPWKKILVIVEGLYSMEGSMVNLPKVIELKEKYKFHLFVDEAHSIGALGAHGRGIVEYYGVNPRSVDIMMGTFTKSFGAAGGYVAGKKSLIDHIRVRSHSGPYAEAMSPPVLTQVIASMASIMGVAPELPKSANGTTSNALIPHPGPAPANMLPSWLDLPPSLKDGTEGQTRLRRLAFNSRYLSRGLKKLGFITYGSDDSPIVPLMLFNPGKMCMFSRMMKQRATPIFTVVVAYPATPLVTSRVRFCLSAAHTKDDVDLILKACDEIGDWLDLKQGSGERWPLQEIMDRAIELVHTDTD